LAIEAIVPFKDLYEGYKGKKLPAQEVLLDFLSERKRALGNVEECVKLFILNVQFLGLLRTVAGSQILIPIEQAMDELLDVDGARKPESQRVLEKEDRAIGTTDWAKVCFYITPIGADGTEERKHSDLFLNSIIEPALKDAGMKVVRADKIGAPGMITAQTMEYIIKARLVIVDLSFHNPNVFYELAIRHASQLPVVHIIRTRDKIPFDISSFRAIQIDNTDIYSLVPQLETIRLEIATFVANALADPASLKNPLTLFCPGLKMTMAEQPNNQVG
jgi:hypothetical protein